MYAFKALHIKWKQLCHSSGMRDFFIYFSGALLLRGTSVIMAPFLLHKLLPEEYGLLALIHSFTSIVTILMGFGLRQVVLSEFFYHSEKQKNQLIATILYIYLFYAVPLLIAALYNRAHINHYIFSNAAPDNLITITLLYCFIFFFVELMYQILAYRRQALLVTYLQVSMSLCIIFCNIFLLFYCNAGIYSMMTSYLCGYTLAGIWGMYTYLETTHISTFRCKISLQETPKYLMLGLPFIPTLLFSWVLSSTTRWLLASMTTLQDVGIYSLADAFGQLYFLIILQPINNAYIPRLMHSFSKDIPARIQAEQQNRKITVYGMLAGLVAISAVCICCRPLLHLLIPRPYQAAIYYLWFIIVGNVFLTGSSCFSAFIQSHQGAWFLAGSVGIPALVNILSNIFFIPIWGIYGAIITTTSAQILYCMMLYYYGSKLLKTLKCSYYTENLSVKRE